MNCYKCGSPIQTADICYAQTGLCDRCKRMQDAICIPFKPVQTGWECPRCHAIHSPDVKWCFCVPPSEIDTRVLGDV